MGIGRPGQRPPPLDAALSLHDGGRDRPGHHELDERLVEGLALVLCVVVGEQVAGGHPQVQRHEGVALGLDAAQHLTDQAPADAVRLHEDEGAFDDDGPFVAMAAR